jgi:hypothetical protein
MRIHDHDSCPISAGMIYGFRVAKARIGPE